MSNKQLYVKFSSSARYDDYYRFIDPKDETWASVLEAVEAELEHIYCLKNYGVRVEKEEIKGIKMNIEIVDELPEDINLDHKDFL